MHGPALGQQVHFDRLLLLLATIGAATVAVAAAVAAVAAVAANAATTPATLSWLPSNLAGSQPSDSGRQCKRWGCDSSLRRYLHWGWHIFSRR